MLRHWGHAVLRFGGALREVRKREGRKGKMKLDDLNVEDWNRHIQLFAQKHEKERFCFRVDGTPFSTAIHCGGFRLDGHQFTIYNPLLVHENPRLVAEGGPQRAFIGVRDDFEAFVKKNLRRSNKGAGGGEPSNVQDELGL